MSALADFSPANGSTIKNRFMLATDQSAEWC